MWISAEFFEVWNILVIAHRVLMWPLWTMIGDMELRSLIQEEPASENFYLAVVIHGK